MAGAALQLFPPPPRAPRQTSPSRRPSPQVKPSTPEPVVERADSAMNTSPPTDFHELVIQVNSVQVSPSHTMSPILAPPPRAHLPDAQTIQTPTQGNRPTFDSPPQAQAVSPNLAAQEGFYRNQVRAPSPSVFVEEDGSLQQPQHMSPDPNRAVSPAFSTCPTLVRGNSTATRVRSSSPEQIVPMRSMFPVYDPTIPLARQTYQPSQASPTHIPRTQISRSPYAPESYVPHNDIRTSNAVAPLPLRPFFTPSNLLDNLWLATNGQEEPAVQIYTLKMHRATAANPTITFGTTPSLPFYSLAQSNLAGSHEVQSIMNELLIQRHHPTQPRVLPIAQLDLIAPPSLDRGAFNAQNQESTTLITTILPKLAALQALDAAANSSAASHLAMNDPGAQSPAAQRLAEDVLAGAAQRECCALAWTKDNPQQQTNPWAQHIPSEGSYQLHHPTLGTFPVQIEGDCSVINTPSTRPVTAMYGHNAPMTPQVSGQKPASIKILNPYVLSPTSPRANAFTGLPPPPPRLDTLNRPTSLTPSEISVGQLPTTTDATADDAILGRLDFTNDTLTLNLGAITRFSNPFLADVITSSILAVAVAEAIRGRRSRKTSHESFDPPPPSFTLTHQKEDTTKAFKESFAEGFHGFGGKAKSPVGLGLKRFASSLTSSTTSRSASTSFDKDIELGEWYGQDKSRTVEAKETKAERKARKKVEEEDKLPFAARGIISVITFAFKAIVFVLRIAIKIIAGIVVMFTRNFRKL